MAWLCEDKKKKKKVNRKKKDLKKTSQQRQLKKTHTNPTLPTIRSKQNFHWLKLLSWWDMSGTQIWPVCQASRRCTKVGESSQVETCRNPVYSRGLTVVAYGWEQAAGGGGGGGGGLVYLSRRSPGKLTPCSPWTWA